MSSPDVTQVVGDDVRSVVSEFQGEGVNIIFAETGGFNGNSYWGYDLVIQSLFENYVEKGVEAAHLSVSFPVANRAVIDRGYTGYRGGLRLTEDLLSAIVAGR